MRPTVLIVDDNATYRESARALLEADGYSVVGAAASGEEAIVAIERLRPEIVLLDIQLPGLDGFAVAERLTTLHEPPTVVLISSRAPAAYAPKLAKAPAKGYISKHALSGKSLASLLD